MHHLRRAVGEITRLRNLGLAFLLTPAVNPQLYQYANENEFCLHRPERRIQLPKHKQMESTGAVIYNGSLFYQRRNSRRIIK